MEENGVSFQLPNQKLPFFRDDFYEKNSFAYLEIDTTEISIQVFDEVNTVNITFNHNRSLEGTWTKTGELKIIESTLNEKETEMLRQNEKVIKEASQELLAIHNSVYDY